MKKMHTYRKSLLCLGVVFIVVTAYMLFRFQNSSNAATTDDVTMITGSTDMGTEYAMRTTYLTVNLQLSSDVPSGYTVKWALDKASEGTSAEFDSTDGTSATIKALSAGTANLTATLSWADGSNNPLTVSCQIDIYFSIMEKSEIGFVKNVLPTDDRASLVTSVEYLSDNKTVDTTYKIPLSLNYGNVADCTWTSGDSNVVTVDSSGEVTPVGAGVTTITAEYKPTNSTVTREDSIKVYVVPKVSYASDVQTEPSYMDGSSSGDELKLHTTQTILTDAAARKSSSEGILNRLTWVITRVENGSRKIISVGTNDATSDDSIFPTSDLIELTANSDSEEKNSVILNAKAGFYNISFFPTGIYEANAEAGVDISTLQAFCTTIPLTVYAEIDNKQATLNIGDSYDLAAAFNMTQDDFTQIFSTALADSAQSEIFNYNALTASGTANEAGMATINITTSASAKSDNFALSNVYDVPSTGAEYSLYAYIRVADGLALDRSSVTMAVGGTLQLIEYHTTTGGTFTWSSDDTGTASVTQDGVIKALKATTDDNYVTITLTQTMDDGNIKRATCKVYVVETVTNIKLNYSDVSVEVDKTVTILATFTPNISTAPIEWLTSDDTVASLSVSSDNKSVVVTGKMPGTTVITAVNSDNYVTASVKITVVSPIETIALNYSQLSVKLSKQEVKLKATYTPTTATSTDLTWSTSNSAVATVDEEGLVSLVAAGTAVITVQPTYNPNLVMAQCVLTVIQSTTGLTLSQTELDLEAGDSEYLTCTLTPTNATADITWKSMDTSVATVSSAGKVTGVSPGKTYIIATSENGYSANCLVIVTKAASGVTLDVYQLTIAIGSSYQVTAIPNPVTSTETTFTWTSKDTSVATVNSSGKVTAVAAGETVILVKTKSGKVTYLYVTVYDKVTAMKLNYTTKTLVKGKKFTLKATFTPSNATNKNVTWDSSSTSIAKVSSSGVVTGVRGGTAVITAVSEDGGYVATCIVKVTQLVTSITLNKSSYTLGIGKTYKLKATVKSNYSTTQTLKWTSSNVAVATVSKSGAVTGKKKGTVTIKCKATDGSGVYATCKIRVVRQVTKITLNKTTIKMLVGKTTKIKATVSPATASYKTVYWSSSDTSVANIDTNGNITANAVGNCKITATAKDNGKKKATCLVYVSKAVPSTGITVAAADKDMVLVRGTSSMVNYTIVPNNTTDSVKFTSDNSSVASVSSAGRVTGRKPGVATITITSSSGKAAVVNVTVVGLNRTSVTAEKYSRIELWVEQVTTGVKWYSENSSIASVDSSGSVVTRKQGTTRIVATVSGVRLYCTIKVS